MIIKKKRRPLPGLIRINCDPEENNFALAHLELKEIEDKGLFCNTCCDERIATLQSFCELKQHIVAKHLNLLVEGNFIIVKNTPANPVSQQFTYYPCTKRGKCFFQSSPQEKLKTHSNQECNNSHDYEEDNYETHILQNSNILKMDHMLQDTNSKYHPGLSPVIKLKPGYHPEPTYVPTYRHGHPPVGPVLLQPSSLGPVLLQSRPNEVKSINPLPITVTDAFTSFDYKTRHPGHYADIETNCEIYHFSHRNSVQCTSYKEACKT